MSETKTYELKCPSCGGNAMEEVMVHVTQSSAFVEVEIFEDGDGTTCEPYYVGTSTEGGEVVRYQCAACGHHIADTPEGLRDWILKNGILKIKAGPQ